MRQGRPAAGGSLRHRESPPCQPGRRRAPSYPQLPGRWPTTVPGTVVPLRGVGPSVPLVPLSCLSRCCTCPLLSGSGRTRRSCVSPGSVKVLRAPTCFSDYLSTSVCQWNMDVPTNCSAELRLSYQLNFMGSE